MTGENTGQSSSIKHFLTNHLAEKGNILCSQSTEVDHPYCLKTLSIAHDKRKICCITAFRLLLKTLYSRAIEMIGFTREHIFNLKQILAHFILDGKTAVKGRALLPGSEDILQLPGEFTCKRTKHLFNGLWVCKYQGISKLAYKCLSVLLCIRNPII